MTTAQHLFDDHAVGPEPTVIRRLALGGALQILRASKSWKVADAAAHADIASMTWRRLEDGLTVRPQTHVAIDRLLSLPFGTVKRALVDDEVMVTVLDSAGVDVAAARRVGASEFLVTFGRQAATGTPRQAREIEIRYHVQPDGRLLTDDGRDARSALSTVQSMIDQVTRDVMTPALRQLVDAAVAAMPDLIDRRTPPRT